MISTKLPDRPPIKDRERLREILLKARDQIVDEWILDEFENHPEEMQAVLVRLNLADTVRQEEKPADEPADVAPLK